MGKVRFDEIIQQGDPLKLLREGLKVTKKELGGFITELEAVAKNIRLVAKASNSDFLKDFEELEKLRKKTKKTTEQLTEAEKIQLAIDKQLLAIEKQRIATTAKTNTNTLKQAQTVAKLNEQNRIQVQQNKQLAQIQATQAGSIARLRLETNKLVQQRDRLGDANGKNKKEFEKLTQSISKNNQALLKYDKAIGRSQRNVGNYGNALSRVSGILSKGLGVLGLTAGVAGLANAFKKALTIFSDFTLQVSKLQAISGASAQQTAKLRKEAENLGKSTQKTAAEVAQLQIEYAKLGFSVDEISAATEATLALSIATGEGLAESASVAGSTLRGFGLEAVETKRVVDVMAASFSGSALDLEKFRESMKLVAPIASAANIDLETTTALLGQLANAGLAGSIAGTGLKNVISKLSNENSALSKELGYSVRNSEDLIKAFKDLETRNIDLTKATELTDERSKAAFITMVRGIDSVEKLQASLKGAEGTVQSMANVMADNLSGDTDKAISAMQGLAISIGDSLEPALRGVTQGFTSFISSLTDTRSEGEQLLDQYKEQNTELNNLEQNIAPLLDRYDELTGKSELTADEQEELNSIIQTVSETVPQAASSFDLYGKALGLNTEIARGNIAAQKELVAALADEAPSELVETLVKLGEEAAIVQKRLNAGDYVTLVNEVGRLEKGFKKLDDVDEIKNLQTDALRLNSDIIKIVESLQLFAFTGEKGTEDLLKSVTREFASFGFTLDKNTRDLKISTGDIFRLIKASISDVNDAAINIPKPVVEELKIEDVINTDLEKDAADELEKLLEQGAKAADNISKEGDREYARTLKNRLRATEKFNKDVLAIEEDLRKQEQAFLDEDLTNLEQHETDMSLAISTSRRSNLEFLRDQQLASDDELYELELANLKQLLFDKQILEENFVKAKIVLDQNYADRQKKINFDSIQAIGRATSQAIGAVMDLQNVQTDNKLRNLDREQDRALSNTRLTEEQRIVIEEDFDRRREELEREAFERNKKLSIARALIDGALSIMRIAADVPKVDFGVTSAILTGVQIAATAAQVATISTQQFKEGGEYSGEGGYTGNMSRNSTSKRLGNKPYDYHGREFILNADKYKNNEVTANMMHEGLISDAEILPALAMMGNLPHIEDANNGSIELDEIYGLLDEIAGNTSRQKQYFSHGGKLYKTDNNGNVTIDE